MRYFLSALTLLILSVSILAQDACPAFIMGTLSTLQEFCSETERNQLCYVNNQILVEASEEIIFDSPGDIANLDTISSIQTQVNSDEEAYGVALMVLQANIPDTLPGQNVTVLVYGDTQVENADIEPINAEETYAPMQAMYFSSGIGRTDCNDLPQDGLLIQTPNIDEPIELVINGAMITLGSTAVITAQPEGEMTVYVVEGEGTVTSENESVVVPEGSQTTVELDEDGNAASPPSEPEAYDSESLASIPLETEIFAAPVTDETLLETSRYVPRFAACWSSIDVDGSDQSMCIFPRGRNLFEVFARDEGGTVCGDTGEATEFAVILTGTGSVNGSDVLETTIDYQCLGGNNASGTVPLSFTPNSDGTLTDSTGVVWSR